MHTNTLKTVLGFFRSFINRRSPFKQKEDSIESIYNYLHIDALFATSGQPSENQFELIRDAGFETVINLAPNSILENSVINEAEVLAALGIKYIHIPVNFKNPTDDDFDKFVSCLENNKETKIWLHCAANMRASAFTYRYRRSVLNEDAKTVDYDLRRIWEPIGVWKKFIQR
jgi:protein tyrosine phosphatase (PTP) superfamily phosphohydrolase (DUF442 family)